MSPSSQISGFYRLSIAERIEQLAVWADLTTEDRTALTAAALDLDTADRMIENVVGVHSLPLGIAVNFQINGRDYLIPMVVEEPSVVAGASYAAKLVRAGGGFQTYSTPSEMIGQLQVIHVVDPWAARFRLLAAREQIFSMANAIDPTILRLGGGMRDLEVDVILDSVVGPMLEVRVVYDCLDAMGANALNTIAERLAPTVNEITGGQVNLRIISNLADRRLAHARCTVPADVLAGEGWSGAEVIERIVAAYAFAAASPYRAATHNKGIMNGVDAVVMASGNDWRAVEAGAHAYAARSGHYTSLSRWEKDAAGNLVGTLEMPLALGTVGGATRVHPTAKTALKILKVKTARELAEVVVAVGLAQNLAAIRALAVEGIQRGHMQLHARQVAIAVGATGDEIDHVVRRMVDQGTVRGDLAQEILDQLRHGQEASSGSAC